MSIKWLLTTPKGLAVLFIIIWVVTAPVAAAHMAHKGAGGVQHVFHSGQTFLSNL